LKRKSVSFFNNAGSWQ